MDQCPLYRGKYSCVQSWGADGNFNLWILSCNAPLCPCQYQWASGMDISPSVLQAQTFNVKWATGFFLPVIHHGNDQVITKQKITGGNRIIKCWILWVPTHSEVWPDLTQRFSANIILICRCCQKVQLWQKTALWASRDDIAIIKISILGGITYQDMLFFYILPVSFMIIIFVFIITSDCFTVPAGYFG